MFRFAVVMVAWSNIPWCLSRDLPSYFPKCSTNDLEFDDCVLRAFNTLRPYATNGIQSIGLPSLNPLIVSDIIISQESSPVNYTVKLHNFTFQGMDNYDIKEFHYDYKTMTISGRIEFDSVTMTTAYEGIGYIIAASIRGKGIGKSIYCSLNTAFEINDEVKQTNGVDYYYPKDVKVRLTIDDGSHYIGGLFVDNEENARMTNNMLNFNSKIVTQAVTPVFERLAQIGLMKFMKSLTKLIPYDKLLPSVK